MGRQVGKPPADVPPRSVVSRVGHGMLLHVDSDPRSAFGKLFTFLDRLEQAKITYRLEHMRESVLICAAVPGERWEIEFFAAGHVEIERFGSMDGVTRDEAEFARLISTYADEQ